MKIANETQLGFGLKCRASSRASAAAAHGSVQLCPALVWSGLVRSGTLVRFGHEVPSFVHKSTLSACNSCNWIEHPLAWPRHAAHASVKVTCYCINIICSNPNSFSLYLALSLCACYSMYQSLSAASAQSLVSAWICAIKVSNLSCACIREGQRVCVVCLLRLAVDSYFVIMFQKQFPAIYTD